MEKNSMQELRFPRLMDCAHFHYDYVSLKNVKIHLLLDEAKVINNGKLFEWNLEIFNAEDSWKIKRTIEDFCKLDFQLHCCIFDRKISCLGKMNLSDIEDSNIDIKSFLSMYISRLNELFSDLICCSSVLNWLEIDNKGNHLIGVEASDINIPAIGAAIVTQDFNAQTSDEISLKEGDLISVLDMPPPEESVWWKGKNHFEVGYFPFGCVTFIKKELPKEVLPYLKNISLPIKKNTLITNKNGKLANILRTFLLTRPSRKKLKQVGILKERIFGCDLSEHLLNSQHSIPLILKCCTEFVEKKGVVDGIYRLSGIASNIQRLRVSFDSDFIPSLHEDENVLKDIHCVSSVLKMYFRELPNPLLTYHLYDQWVEAVRSPVEIRLKAMHSVVSCLPPPHFRTLQFLIYHLRHMAELHLATNMSAKNLAIVWAPNLLRSQTLETGRENSLQDVGLQAVITEFLIHHAQALFLDHAVNIDSSNISNFSANHGTNRASLKLRRSLKNLWWTRRFSSSKIKPKYVVPISNPLNDQVNKSSDIIYFFYFQATQTNLCSYKSANNLISCPWNLSKEKENPLITSFTHSRTPSYDSYFNHNTLFNNHESPLQSPLSINSYYLNANINISIIREVKSVEMLPKSSLLSSSYLSVPENFICFGKAAISNSLDMQEVEYSNELANKPVLMVEIKEENELSENDSIIKECDFFSQSSFEIACLNSADHSPLSYKISFQLPNRNGTDNVVDISNSYVPSNESVSSQTSTSDNSVPSSKMDTVSNTFYLDSKSELKDHQARRLRIEYYKEQRRQYLRDQFNSTPVSDSKSDDDLLLARLKQRFGKQDEAHNEIMRSKMNEKSLEVQDQNIFNLKDETTENNNKCVDNIVEINSMQKTNGKYEHSSKHNALNCKFLASSVNDLVSSEFAFTHKRTRSLKGFKNNSSPNNIIEHGSSNDLSSVKNIPYIHDLQTGNSPGHDLSIVADKKYSFIPNGHVNEIREKFLRVCTEQSSKNVLSHKNVSQSLVKDICKKFYADPNSKTSYVCRNNNTSIHQTSKNFIESKHFVKSLILDV